MKEYKQEIEATRIGCLGSSDAKLVAQVATLGSVPKTAYERLAILKGFATSRNPVSTAMLFGDRIENEIYEYLKIKYPSIKSNPLWESEKYKCANFRCISHPDYVLEDPNKKVVYVYEVKASKMPNAQVRQEYRCQLYWHYQLAVERARELGKEWRHKVFLVHYDTEGIDYDNHEFDANRLNIKEVRFHMPAFDMAKGLSLIDAFLDDFNEYYGNGDEIDANLLPQEVYKQFELVCGTLRKIKDMETKVEAFKNRIYDFMLSKGIKNIKNEFFTISRVDPTESVSFDFKRFLEEEGAIHPIKVRKWIRMYEKHTKRKGYATIKIKNND